MTKPRPSPIYLIPLAMVACALAPGAASAAEAGDPSSVLDDSDQAVPANDLHPYRNDGPVMVPLFRPTRMGRSDFWIVDTLEWWKLRAASRLGRASFRSEVEESVLFIR